MTAPAGPDTTVRYQRSVTAVREMTLRLALQMWDNLGSYRDADMQRLIQWLMPRVQAGQTQIAHLTAAYMAAMLAEQGVAAETAVVDPLLILAARGVPFEEVYARPAVQLYSALAKGLPFDEALAMGRNRLQSLVSTDMQMAKVRQSRESLRRSDAKFYRRVLNGPQNCAKCIITSTQRYRKRDLLPIHPGCDCTVAPIRASDPPLVLDEALLQATHEQVSAFAGIENRSAEGYLDLIVTHEHGEIGPVMAWRNQNFTGPADI